MFLRDGMRNILGPVGIRIEHHHAQRIAVLPIYQIGYSGFIVGAVGVTPARRRRIGLRTAPLDYDTALA
jgi:hypothetical protein